MSENKDNHECCGAHNHEAGEGCGCGHNHVHEHTHYVEDANDAVEYITITLEDGKDHSCAILGTFAIEQYPEKEYMALLPEGTEEVIIFSFTVDEDELSLDPIPDDEFEVVAKEFMSLYGEENFED